MRKLTDNKQLITNNKRYRLSFISYRSRAGFTIVELIVAMGVFLIAITLAIGVFVQALKTQRIVNYLMSVNSNASIALEGLARELRTGYAFSLSELDPPPPNPCLNPQFDRISFKNSNSKLVTYDIENGVLARQECDSAGCAGAEPFMAITASNILVSRLCFTKTQPTSNDPWRISIFLTVGSPNPDLATNVLNLETTVSSRILPQDVQ
ncbi:MAG: hypothetical protein UY23_C0001G0292 [Candidatus Jorgensenbacteria bacterium GW2011_GWA1_48_11]|uniref:Prepilin-type N-terminal cleavage/methylation domain-containing protein n=1 Tax=Candidatus Jorgensenbacteria bacterium GW2011_GWA1_48_11 TaxID=1618660 RepID=A0A0G1UC03_9BACT|nr:MAG: hypothetical protein UY23_C0001G0292 [Candidatus Jorgensenbacteria bacterium GW2011_GWA1_48_11]KKW12177.1 MAG: hypothetical protein UY51_C0005G0419 [Candidatus Jorgensenbacteria bacterium GW2011_GWB1_49_9]